MDTEITRPRRSAPISLRELADRLGARLDSPATEPVSPARDTETADSSPRVAVTGVAGGTDRVLPGDVFVAIPGARTHGASFAREAVEAGAVAIITDAAGAEHARDAGVPVLVVEHPRSALADASGIVHSTRAIDTVLFAVTGTNGKTTTTYMVRDVIKALGLRAGLAGTVERIVGNKHIDTSDSGRLTTPEADVLHGLAARMHEDHVAAAAIEVSSHGIDGGRIDGLPFDVSIFTNFSQDHLDEYGTMERYFAAKMALFTPEHTRRAVIVIDDEWGKRAAREAQVPVTTVAMDAEAGADWTVEVNDTTLAHTEFRMRHRSGDVVDTTVGMPGWFTALDAALAIAAVLDSRLGITADDLRAALGERGGVHPSVPGRIELASGDAPVRVYVDYGHTEASFRTVLQSLREFTDGRLFMVFGADGDRDRTKRPAMARAASEVTDVVVVTDYNPRTEDPTEIRRTLVDTIRREFPEREVYEVAAPAEGIRKAISLARAGDIVFVGGHGHRRDVEVGGKLVPFSAMDAVRDALRAEGWLTSA
ncbi:UDP-N-acetylmuramoyl-L-alanyl-D-glutamate--2,6-diaminopimelate ligase [Pseudoclavibacter endophyticus]|nr:UDP-N-acetylmuramoyl-L-alanyl-D-glutamate--2,6-diaminopimelate ligase [Pseudoclavibacter endophyticus]GGA66279.1 UDP-N-acetylmuramoyl-L-alanyl-D-glutamate--2,6-diaminopimelate ligase [Pseudoclavibacter endophyticus]